MKLGEGNGAVKGECCGVIEYGGGFAVDEAGYEEEEEGGRGVRWERESKDFMLESLRKLFWCLQRHMGNFFPSGRRSRDGRLGCVSWVGARWRCGFPSWDASPC